MLTRRDVVTGVGALGAVAVAPGSGDAAADAAAQSAGDPQLAQGLRDIRSQMKDIRDVLDVAIRENTLSFGAVSKLRTLFEQFIRASGKFPDYCDIGTGVFYDIYDWHVKHVQPIQITRQQDNRVAIRFMFTTLVVRQEQESSFIGIPYDRG
jgi:hypothetical protein